MSDHVFICYAREDEAFVLQLGENLKGRGVPVWIDQWDIPPGSDWDRSIDDAIYDCAKFIIVLSSQSVESSEIRGELRTALDEKERIIPVIHSACRIPRQLRTIQHVDFTSRAADDEAVLKQLLRTLAASTVIEVAQAAEATDKAVQETDDVGFRLAPVHREALPSEGVQTVPAVQIVQDVNRNKNVNVQDFLADQRSVSRPLKNEPGFPFQP